MPDNIYLTLCTRRHVLSISHKINHTLLQANTCFYLCLFRKSLRFIAVDVNLNRRSIAARPTESVDDSGTVGEDDSQALKLEEQNTRCAM